MRDMPHGPTRPRGRLRSEGKRTPHRLIHYFLAFEVAPCPYSPASPPRSPVDSHSDVAVRYSARQHTPPAHPRTRLMVLSVLSVLSGRLRVQCVQCVRPQRFYSVRSVSSVRSVRSVRWYATPHSHRRYSPQRCVILYAPSYATGVRYAACVCGVLLFCCA